MDEHAQALGLKRVLEDTGITLGELWPYYFSLGGNVLRFEVDAYLHGMMALPVLQRDVLAHAANELTADLPNPPRAPYSWPSDVRLPSDTP